MKLFLIALIFTQINNQTFDFVDKCGNKFVIKNTSGIDPYITQEFFKNLSSEMLNNEYCQKQYNFEFIVWESKKLSKNEYDVRIAISPKTSNIEEIIRYMGVSHYSMKVKVVGGKATIEKLKWIYGEI